MDKHASSCSKSLEDRSNEDFQHFGETPAVIDEVDSDENENPVNLSDNSYDDLPVSEDDDVQLSSPSNSLNSDVDQRWYAFRGRWGINMMDNNHNDINNRQMDNRLPEINQPQVQQQQEQEEEEADFLEMDFEPDTNSEIENEAKFSDYVLPNGHASNTNSFNFHPLPLPLQLPQPDFRLLPLITASTEPENFQRPASRNTGAKPKQPSRAPKPSKQVSDGDNIFKLMTVSSNSINNNNNGPSTSLSHLSSNFIAVDEVYNLGASSSRATHINERLYSHSPNFDANPFLKIHKSPSKSSSHHNHKHLRLHEEQNDQFLFEIEPLKPRNSVTIYTTNCDEKILLDALVS